VVANDKLLKFWKYSSINLKKVYVREAENMISLSLSLSLDNIFISEDLYTSVILYGEIINIY